MLHPTVQIEPAAAQGVRPGLLRRSSLGMRQLGSVIPAVKPLVAIPGAYPIRISVARFPLLTSLKTGVVGFARVMGRCFFECHGFLLLSHYIDKAAVDKASYDRCGFGFGHACCEFAIPSYAHITAIVARAAHVAFAFDFGRATRDDYKFFFHGSIFEFGQQFAKVYVHAFPVGRQHPTRRFPVVRAVYAVAFGVELGYHFYLGGGAFRFHGLTILTLPSVFKNYVTVLLFTG